MVRTKRMVKVQDHKVFDSVWLSVHSSFEIISFIWKFSDKHSI